MPHRSLLVLLVAATATLNVLSGAAQGQTPAPPPLTYELAVTMTWKNPHNRILEMAKDTVFPDDKLGWKPLLRSRIRSWKSLPRRYSSAGSVTRPSMTASSSPTTRVAVSGRYGILRTFG